MWQCWGGMSSSLEIQSLLPSSGQLNLRLSNFKIPRLGENSKVCEFQIMMWLVSQRLKIRARWYMPIIIAPSGSQDKEIFEFKASLGYKGRPCFVKQNKTLRNQNFRTHEEQTIQLPQEDQLLNKFHGAKIMVQR